MIKGIWLQASPSHNTVSLEQLKAALLSAITNGDYAISDSDLMHLFLSFGAGSENGLVSHSQYISAMTALVEGGVIDIDATPRTQQYRIPDYESGDEDNQY